jgi:hypothetical protein
MAATLALAFQSSHLQDGMAEYVRPTPQPNTMQRLNLFTTQILDHDQRMQPDSRRHLHKLRLRILRKPPSKRDPTQSKRTNQLTPQAFREDGHLQTMRNRIGTANHNHISHTDLDLAAHSLRAIKALSMASFERAYFDILALTVSHAYFSPEETYNTFVGLYNAPSSWTHDEFQSFIDPNNAVAQILLAHFIAIQAILTPILYLERVGFQGVNAPTCVLGWIEGIYMNVPSHLRGHVEWPREVSRYPFMRFLGQRQVNEVDREEDSLLLLG